MKVCKSFHFDAAHYLPGYEGPCGELHGHRWTLEVELKGFMEPDTGMVIDFTELKTLVELRVISELDHTCLNKGKLPEVPTCENLIYWIWDKLDINYGTAELNRLRLYETPDSFAELTREEVDQTVIGGFELLSETEGDSKFYEVSGKKASVSR